MRRAWLLLWPAGVGVGLLAEWVAYEFGDPYRWVPDLVVGWTLISCGLVAWRGRPDSRIGALLVGSGFTWFLGNLAGAEVAWLAWVGRHGIYVHRGPLIHAVLTFPTGRPTSRTERVTVGVFYTAAVLTPVWGNEWSTIALAALLVAIAAGRYANSVAAERRARRTAMRLAVVLGVVLAGGAIARLVLPGDVAEDASLLTYQLALCLIAVGLTSGLLSRRWEQVAVTDLVVDLGAARSDTLRDALAHALGDPTLDVGYWSPEVESFVDATGRRLALPDPDDGRASTVVEGGRGPIAVLVHHPALLDDPALVESVTAATRLASVHARLQAEVQAQIDELDASRRRIVTAGDEERRRLEARLRTGPERRLEGLARRLAAARATSENEPTGALLTDLDAQLAATLDELRTLAAGLHPRLLTECGLARALEALAARCPTPVELRAPNQRLPAAIEAAVYFVCSEALTNIAKHAAATSASVTIDIGDRVVVEVGDDGVGGADPSGGSGLRNLIDRIEALGGTLLVAGARPRGTRLVAELPLGDGTS